MSILHQIAITKINNVGPVSAKSIIAHLGSPEALWSANESDLVVIPQLPRSRQNIY